MLNAEGYDSDDVSSVFRALTLLVQDHHAVVRINDQPATELRIRTGTPVTITAKCPARWESGFRALVFEHDQVTGRVNLLSEQETGFKWEVQLPRQQRKRPSGGGPQTGTLRFMKPGQSVIMIVAMANDAYRLDQSPAFEARRSYSGPSEGVVAPAVSAAQLCDLLEVLGKTPADKWVVRTGLIHRVVTIV